jgi:hypothetical protein
MCAQVARFAFGDAVLEPNVAAQEAMKEAADQVRHGKVPDVAKHGGWCARTAPLESQVPMRWYSWPDTRGAPCGKGWELLPVLPCAVCGAGPCLP